MHILNLVMHRFIRLSRQRVTREAGLEGLGSERKDFGLRPILRGEVKRERVSRDIDESSRFRIYIRRFQSGSVGFV